MERFAIKIDNSLKLNLYKLCRLCGIDNPDKQPIIDTKTLLGIQDSADDEPLCKKIFDCVGVQVKKNDQMPQSICVLCADKINDFFEYREMCIATQQQTRKLLGLPEMTIASTSGRKRKKNKDVQFHEGESILGILGKEEDDKKDIIDSIPVKKPRKNVKDTQKTNSKTKKNNLIVAKEEDEDEIKIEDETTPSISKKGKVKANPEGVGKKKSAKSVKFATASEPPLLTLKEPNERERKRELQMQKMEQKKRKGGPNLALIPMAKKLKTETDTTPTIAPMVIPSKCCRICPDIFESVHLLNEHYISSHVPTVFEYGCSSCLECFKTLAEHKDHLLWHSLSKTMYTCGICNAVFDKTQTFTRHLSHCSSGSAALVLDDVPCALCNLVFPTKNLHDWHDCYIRPNGKCQRCHRHFVRKNILFKHAVRCTAKPQLKKVAPIVAAQDLPMVSLPPNAVKSEPEAIIDTEGAPLTINDTEASDNEYASNHGDDHFAESDESDDDRNDDVAASEAMVPGEIHIKSEPTVNYADEDDDVILIEDTIDPIIIGDTSPQKKKDRKSKKHKRDRQRTQMLMMAIKQEPHDDTEHPLTNSTGVISNEPMVRIKMEPVDETELPTSSTVLTKRKDKKKHKHKRNKRPSPEFSVIHNAIIKQEPVDDHNVPTAATTLPIPTSSSPPEDQPQPSDKESNLMPSQQPLVTLPNINEHITMPTVVMNNIKKEPSSVGYDAFDPKVALNIKKERGIDKSPAIANKQPSLRLKITKEHGTLNAKIIPNQSKGQYKPNKSKNVYKKPALLAEKIRQEMMQRLAKENDSSSVPQITQVSSADGTQSAALQIPIIANVHTQLDTQLMLRAIKEERHSPDPEYVYNNDSDGDIGTNDTAGDSEEVIDMAVEHQLKQSTVHADEEIAQPEQSTENTEKVIQEPVESTESTDKTIEQPKPSSANTDKACSGELKDFKTSTIIQESVESIVKPVSLTIEPDSLALPANSESSADIESVPTISSLKPIIETQLVNTGAQPDEPLCTLAASVNLTKEAVSENTDYITMNSDFAHEVSEEKSVSVDVESVETGVILTEPMTKEILAVNTESSAEQSVKSVVEAVKTNSSAVHTETNSSEEVNDIISTSNPSSEDPNQELLTEPASSLDSIDDLSSEVVKQLETLLEQSDDNSVVPPEPHTSIAVANIFERSAPNLSPDRCTVFSTEIKSDYTETDVMAHVTPICNPEAVESTSIIPADLDIDTHEFAASTTDACDGKLNKSNTSAYDDDLEDISDDSLSSDLQMDNNPIDLDLEKRLLDEPTGETNY